MKALNLILSTIEKLEAKRDNFTITFDESAQLMRLIELAENIVSLKNWNSNEHQSTVRVSLMNDFKIK